MPGLGRTQQVLIMTLLWALLLIVIDKKFNTHPERSSGSGSATKPQIIFGFNHLCCTGCAETVFTAIKHQPWLTSPMLYKHDPMASDTPMASMPGMSPTATMSSHSMGSMSPMTSSSTPAQSAPTQPTPTQPLAAQPLQSQQDAQTVKPHSAPTYYGEVIADMDPTQVNITDLMKITREMEMEGLAMETFKVVNVPHFNLHIVLPHLCCPTCTSAVGKICDFSAQNPLYDDSTRLPTLAKANVELDGLTLEFGHEAKDKNPIDNQPTDLAVVLKVLRRIGYVPKEMHIAVLQ